MKYRVSAGPNATGRNKETHKREFAFRVSKDKRFVAPSDPKTIDIDPEKEAVLLECLQDLDLRGFVSLEPVETPAKTPKAADAK